MLTNTCSYYHSLCTYPGNPQIQLTNKIRISFVDAEMAKRREVQSPAMVNLIKSTNNGNAENPQASNGMPISIKQGTSTNPGSAQQLSEVDLGASAHELNLARTQAALERARLGK